MKNLTKSQTLHFLSKKKFFKKKILPQQQIYLRNWRDNKIFYLKLIKKKFSPNRIVIRSSFSKENSSNNSNAGKYQTYTNIDPTNFKLLKKCIENVFKSYKSKNFNEHIFIQRYIEKSKLSGVAFSHDQSSGIQYRTINYTRSNDTSLVTSGKQNSETEIYFDKYVGKNTFFKKIDLILNKLLKIYKYPLDIEFCVNQKNEIILFQVRKLIVKNNLKEKEKLEVIKILNEVKRKINSKMKENIFLNGKKNILAVMPDWNPAEIIGRKPRPLALSLYKELITDNIWAYQRDNYGYKNLRSFPVLTTLAQQPFIDVRVSFNSFLPKNLPDYISKKLINFYINKFKQKTNLHDKVEFNIVYSCFYFGIYKKILSEKKLNLKNSEIKFLITSLKKITLDIIKEPNSLLNQDFNKIKVLKQRKNKILNSNMNILDKIYWLIEDIKRYGTLPFAGLARAGFVGTQILHSLKDQKLISENQYHSFLEQTSTISKKFVEDLKHKNLNYLIKNYGHLRPGTYDITSLSYKDSPNIFFQKSKKIINKKITSQFRLDHKQITKINNLLKKEKMNLTCQELFTFIKKSIEFREFSKFEFTKSLSLVLDFLKLFGKRYDISSEDMSFFDISYLTKIIEDTNNKTIFIKDLINKNKKNFKLTSSINLPSIILDKSDIYNFKLLDNEPNFITNKKVQALVTKKIKDKNLNKKIAVIENADPGYDWIFSKNISGLITCYGGKNSHMSIRCNEMQIPAAIGVGEKIFNSISDGNIVKLDCSSNILEILN